MVLHGAGGSGKTTVAVDVASDLAGRDVWWVDAGTETSLVAGLHAVAVAAGVNLDRVREAWTRGIGAAPELLWDTLNARSADWLLVLDNADDPDLLAAGQGRVHERRGWLRAPGEHGAVLVTTRTTFAEYHHAWEERFVELSDLSWDTEPACERELLCRTWELSLDLLDRRGRPLARPLLRTLACWAVPPHRQCCSTRPRWQRPRCSPGSPQRHSTQQCWRSAGSAWSRQTRQARSPRSVCTLLTRIGLAELLRKSGDLRTAETEFRAITRILDASPSLGNRQPYLALALTLHERGRLTEAEAILRDELARARHELGDHHQHTIMLMSALVDLLLELGKVAEAAPLITTAMAASTALVGPDHEETLVLRTRVAAALADNGDTAGAEAEFRDILAIVEKTKGEDHPMALDARRILATTLENAGNVVEAEAEYRRLFEVESRLHGPDAVGWRTRFALANVQIKRGDHQAAERALRKILVERTRSGATGSMGITVRLRLAACLALRGDLDGAEAECRTALNAARTSLGLDHPETARASTQLAELLIATGDPAGSAQLMREAHAAHEPDPLATLAARVNQAALLRASGAFTEALAELRDIVRVAERAGHLDHPDILHVRHNYAAAAMDAGELAEAEHVLRAALPVVEARMGDDHLDAVRLRLRLGQLLHKTGDTANAEQLLTTVATTLERVHLTESEMARTARYLLALQAFQRGDLATAKTATRDLLAIGRRTAGPQDRLTLETQLLLFTTLHRMGSRTEANAVARDLLRKARAHDDIITLIRQLRGH